MGSRAKRRERANKVARVKQPNERPPQSQVHIVASQSQSKTSVSFSPFPHVDDMERFEVLLPGSTNRILTMTEENGVHRRKLEEKVVDHQIALELAGQRLALFVALAIVASGTFAIYKGHAQEAALIIVGCLSVGGIAAAARRWLGNHDRNDQDPPA